ncbi:hypothetical protein TcYC6_0034350 [Trypanosoma cruzi]|nr:hypothetical protein TcYC6_0034350 [Trypanosoma cruzi]
MALSFVATRMALLLRAPSCVRCAAGFSSHGPALVRGTAEGAETRDGLRVAVFFRTFASSTKAAPFGSLSQFPDRGLRVFEGPLRARGQRDAVHDGRSDPCALAAHGARAPVRVGAALVIVEEGRHDIVVLCVLRGRGMPAIVRDMEDTELFD